METINALDWGTIPDDVLFDTESIILDMDNVEEISIKNGKIYISYKFKRTQKD